MANEVNNDVQAVQARAKLRSGRMRSLVRDLTEAADGLDVWAQLSEGLATKQRQHDAAVAKLRADYDAESARLTASLETARAETQAANKRRDDADAEAAEAEARRDRAKADAANEELRLAAARAAHAEFRQKVGV